MLKYENECVNCPSDIGCISEGCPYRKVKHFYCDCCGEDDAKYRIDDYDLCEPCATKYLNDIFVEFTTEDKATFLGISMKRIEDN